MAVAAAINTAAESPSTDDPTTPPPSVPRELRFSETFVQSPVDLHWLLLQEAHRKHGVALSVPPQLPPVGTPPEVPDVIFCDAQAERMRNTKLLYAPTYGPPPLSTTGTRGLLEAMIATALDPPPKPQASPASLPPQAATAISPSAVKRKEVEADKKFHCSICAKPFRIQLSAEHHLSAMHAGVAGAAILEGPGPGELVIIGPDSPPEAVPPATTDAASSTTAASAPEQSGGTATVNTDVTAAPPLTLAAYKRAPPVTLPSEDDIRHLLVTIWDELGARRAPEAPPAATAHKIPVASFVRFADVVMGVADDRKPISELDLKPLVRATPEGAAPGVRRVIAASTAAGGKLGASVSKPHVSIKELSARYPSPFGDSADRQLLEQMKQEPLNPFLPPEGAVVPTVLVRSRETGEQVPVAVGTPSLDAASAARPYVCPLCPQRFRLLDAVMDHCQDVHQCVMDEEVLERLRAASVTRNPMIVSPDLQKEVSAGSELPSSTDTATSSSSEPANRPPQGEGGILDSSGPAGAALPPLPVVEQDVGVHIRSLSNTILVGEVVDVQRGFVKAVPIVQFVVKTTWDSCPMAQASTLSTTASTSPSSDDATAADAPAPSSTEEVPASNPLGAADATSTTTLQKTADGGEAGRGAQQEQAEHQKEGGASKEEEFFVVRVTGDALRYVVDSVRVGHSIMVHGTLKMNRHLDDVSKRVHAYPFVQVTAPLGSIVVVDV